MHEMKETSPVVIRTPSRGKLVRKQSSSEMKERTTPTTRSRSSRPRLSLGDSRLSSLSSMGSRSSIESRSSVESSSSFQRLFYLRKGMSKKEDLLSRHSQVGYDPLDRALKEVRQELLGRRSLKKKATTPEKEAEYKERVRNLLREHIEMMAEAGVVFHHVFHGARLGFAIVLARYGEEGREFISVEETKKECEIFSSGLLRPTDELIAVDGRIILEPTAERFDDLRKAIENRPRPLKLTFIQGERRDEAFAEQEERQKMQSSDKNNTDNNNNSKKLFEAWLQSSQLAETQALEALEATEAAVEDQKLNDIKVHLEEAAAAAAKAAALAEAAKHYSPDTRDHAQCRRHAITRRSLDNLSQKASDHARKASAVFDHYLSSRDQKNAELAHRAEACLEQCRHSNTRLDSLTLQAQEAAQAIDDDQTEYKARAQAAASACQALSSAYDKKAAAAVSSRQEEEEKAANELEARAIKAKERLVQILVANDIDDDGVYDGAAVEYESAEVCAQEAETAARELAERVQRTNASSSSIAACADTAAAAAVASRRLLSDMRESDGLVSEAEALDSASNGAADLRERSEEHLRRASAELEPKLEKRHDYIVLTTRRAEASHYAALSAEALLMAENYPDQGEACALQARDAADEAQALLMDDENHDSLLLQIVRSAQDNADRVEALLPPPVLSAIPEEETDLLTFPPDEEDDQVVHQQRFIPLEEDEHILQEDQSSARLLPAAAAANDTAILSAPSAPHDKEEPLLSDQASFLENNNKNLLAIAAVSTAAVISKPMPPQEEDLVVEEEPLLQEEEASVPKTEDLLAVMSVPLSSHEEEEEEVVKDEEEPVEQEQVLETNNLLSVAAVMSVPLSSQEEEEEEEEELVEQEQVLETNNLLAVAAVMSVPLSSQEEDTVVKGEGEHFQQEQVPETDHLLAVAAVSSAAIMAAGAPPAQEEANEAALHNESMLESDGALIATASSTGVIMSLPPAQKEESKVETEARSLRDISRVQLQLAWEALPNAAAVSRYATRARAAAAECAGLTAPDGMLEDEMSNSNDEMKLMRTVHLCADEAQANANQALLCLLDDAMKREKEEEEDQSTAVVASQAELAEAKAEASAALAARGMCDWKLAESLASCATGDTKAELLASAVKAAKRRAEGALTKAEAQRHALAARCETDALASLAASSTLRGGRAVRSIRALLDDALVDDQAADETGKMKPGISLAESFQQFDTLSIEDQKTIVFIAASHVSNLSLAEDARLFQKSAENADCSTESRLAAAFDARFAALEAMAGHNAILFDLASKAADAAEASAFESASSEVMLAVIGDQASLASDAYYRAVSEKQNLDILLAEAKQASAAAHVCERMLAFIKNNAIAMSRAKFARRCALSAARKALARHNAEPRPGVVQLSLDYAEHAAIMAACLEEDSSTLSAEHKLLAAREARRAAMECAVLVAAGGVLDQELKESDASSEKPHLVLANIQQAVIGADSAESIVLSSTEKAFRLQWSQLEQGAAKKYAEIARDSNNADDIVFSAAKEAKLAFDFGKRMSQAKDAETKRYADSAVRAAKHRKAPAAVLAYGGYPPASPRASPVAAKAEASASSSISSSSSAGHKAKDASEAMFLRESAEAHARNAKKESQDTLEYVQVFQNVHPETDRRHSPPEAKLHALNNAAAAAQRARAQADAAQTLVAMAQQRLDNNKHSHKLQKTLTVVQQLAQAAESDANTAAAALETTSTFNKKDNTTADINDDSTPSSSMHAAVEATPLMSTNATTRESSEIVAPLTVVQHVSQAAVEADGTAATALETASTTCEETECAADDSTPSSSMHAAVEATPLMSTSATTRESSEIVAPLTVVQQVPQAAAEADVTAATALQTRSTTCEETEIAADDSTPSSSMHAAVEATPLMSSNATTRESSEISAPHTKRIPKKTDVDAQFLLRRIRANTDRAHRAKLVATGIQTQLEEEEIPYTHHEAAAITRHCARAVQEDTERLKQIGLFLEEALPLSQEAKRLANEATASLLQTHRRVLLVGDIDDLNDEECSSDRKSPKSPLVKGAADVYEESRNKENVIISNSPALDPWLELFGLHNADIMTSTSPTDPPPSQPLVDEDAPTMLLSPRR